MNSPKIVTADIETSPYKTYVWKLWGDMYIAPEQIVEDRTILAACFKPLGKAPEYLDTSGKRKPRDDKTLTKWLWKQLDSADIVVTQNGKRFDLPIINSRFAHYGMPPPSPYAVVDTRQVAKTKFGFASNKLEWLLTELTELEKLKHKRFPGFSLWTECLAKNPAAWFEMRKYNIRDVVGTEKVYEVLRPWMTNHPYAGASGHSCGNCGSKNLQRRGTRRTVSFIIERLQCLGCGAWQSGARTKVK